MTREAGLCCGLSTVMAGQLAPGRHDASCTLVVKFSSATRLSLSAGQPKPARASLLTQVCGTAVRRPLVMDSSSSCTARAPAAESSLKPTWTARKLPSGLKAALATELASGSSTDTCRPLGRLCPRQAAVGPLLDQVPGRKPELRPERPASDADLPRRACGRARIGTWRVAGQPQRA